MERLSRALISAQIKVILLGVTGVGTKVHEYERWAANWKDYLAFFKEGSKIKGWTITRTKTPETSKTPSTNTRIHTFIIRGYYSLDDSEATEETFQDLIESIATAFRTEPTINGTAFDSSPLQVDTVAAVMFSNVLCHFCQLRLDVEEEKQWR